MNGFEKRASLIKEKIMRTTLDMLRTSELKRIRIADISKAAKVSQVTIYNYFGSKEELLREVFRNYFDQAIRDFEQYMSEGHSMKEKIEHIIFLEKESYNDFPPGLIKELLIDDEELSVIWKSSTGTKPFRSLYRLFRRVRRAAKFRRMYRRNMSWLLSSCS